MIQETINFLTLGNVDTMLSILEHLIVITTPILMLMYKNVNET
jgi:hypothetical protein